VSADSTDLLNHLPLWPSYRLDTENASRIESLRPILEWSEIAAEEERRLPEAAVSALSEGGFFAIALPRELGGGEVDRLAETEICEAIARISTSAAWNIVVAALHSTLPAVLCSDEVVAEIFDGSRAPIVAGQPAPLGKAKPVGGGMVVSGRYSWGSGISQAGWVIGGCRLDQDDGAPPQSRVWIAPKDDVVVLDNWHVAGLSGTGSSDYVVSELFIADGWWFPSPDMGPLRQTGELPITTTERGGSRYRAPIRLWPLSGHIGLVLGAAEHSLEEIAALASRKQRLHASSSVADREVFRRDLALAYVALSAARDHTARLFSELTALTDSNRPVPADLAHRLYGLTAQSSQLATSTAQMAHTYAAGDSVQLSTPLQRILRDLLVAQQHIIYTDTHLERLGTALIDQFAEA
jgi:alkylation response protein AidB-like acyl-CoA dehydrogenase